MEARPVDLLIRADYVVTDPHEPPVADGFVAVNSGVVLDVGQGDGAERLYAPGRVLDRRNCLVMPGLINTHTHAAMTLFRGLADDLPLKTWLEEHIFPREARLTRDLVALGTRLACAEMIRCGTSGFVDMYLFEDAVAEVVDQVGLRGWLGEGVFDFPSPAFPSGREALEETRRLMEKWRGHDRVTITIDPHTPYTCAPSLLEEAGQLASDTGAMMVIHLAETSWEQAEIKRRYGVSPAFHLDGLGLLNDRLLAVHGVSLTGEEMELLGEKRVRLAHCPESNHKLGSGTCPVLDLMEAGVLVSLGTDGAASNNDLDLLSEMDFAAKIPKGVRRDPTLLSAPDALAMATTWAARALHRPDLGRITPGSQADMAVVDLHSPHLVPCYNPVSQIVYSARSGDVRDLLVAGSLLMEDRVLKTIDEEALFAEVREAARRLSA